MYFVNTYGEKGIFKIDLDNLESSLVLAEDGFNYGNNLAWSPTDQRLYATLGDTEYVQNIRIRFLDVIELLVILYHFFVV